uniref:Uncharacterized protein n=1 Tax=Vibrio cyclitrophicus TaxID=47951 RepID=A0A0H3ZLJ0_9VIBR|nr:hypothetical protein [Vibrio cyclitrophicus]
MKYSILSSFASSQLGRWLFFDRKFPFLAKIGKVRVESVLA